MGLIGRKISVFIMKGEGQNVILHEEGRGGVEVRQKVIKKKCFASSSYNEFLYCFKSYCDPMMSFFNCLFTNLREGSGKK